MNTPGFSQPLAEAPCSATLAIPRHGGNLGYAQARFGTPLRPWQDLSTGISPWPYPVPEIPADIWQRLPGNQAPLLNAAANYYGVGSTQLLALPGSQFAIQRFARYLPTGRVAIPHPGYQEHWRSWQAAGHQVYPYSDAVQLQQLVSSGRVDHALVINPNNPSTQVLDTQLLAQVHDQLSGYLLVDEAFADYRQQQISATPLLAYCPRLFILRSLGKFFGLAGLRLGFLLGSDKSSGKVRQALAAELDSWAISHPAIWLGARALRDNCWQIDQRLRIATQERLLEQQLHSTLGGAFSIHTAGLFATLRGAHKPLYQLYTYLARQGLFGRWCYELDEASHGVNSSHSGAATIDDNTTPATEAWLRLGLPADGGAQLAQALDTLSTATRHYKSQTLAPAPQE